MDNVNRSEAYHKSRLGRILLKRGYVTEAQLEKAAEVQKETGQKLGEALLAMRDISRFQLRRALSNQTRIRFASSLAIALLQPLQALSGQSEQSKDDSDAAVQSTDQLTRLIAPLVNSLTTSDGFQALEYDPNEARAEIRANGSIRLRVPCSLGELRFEHLRIKASASQDYEQLSIADVDLTSATFAVRAIR